MAGSQCDAVSNCKLTLTSSSMKLVCQYCLLFDVPLKNLMPFRRIIKHNVELSLIISF